MFTWSHLISCTVSWEWSKSLWNCDLQCCSNLTNFKEWWKIEGAIKKLQPTIIAIFDYVLLFHKFYVSNNFYPLLIKKCLKEVLQNRGNTGHLPLVVTTPWPPYLNFVTTSLSLIMWSKDNIIRLRHTGPRLRDRKNKLGDRFSHKSQL